MIGIAMEIRIVRIEKWRVGDKAEGRNEESIPQTVEMLMFLSMIIMKIALTFTTEKEKRRKYK